MHSNSLDYMPPENGRGSRRFRRLMGFVGAAMLILFLLPVVTAYTVENQMDPVTGSMNHRTIWWLGIVINERTDVSPLESRLKLSGIARTRSWQPLHSRYYCLLGCYGVGCAPAPQIYSFVGSLKAFVDASSDREIQDFVKVMQTGTPVAQAQAIDAASRKLYGGT